MSLRAPNQEDTAPLGQLAEAAGLFPADYMPDIIAPALAGAKSETWLVTKSDGAPDGFAFARAEEMADRVWNILAIAVAETARRSGIASNLLHALEVELDARMIVIETTQLPEQSVARAFYTKEGYEHVATLPDFFAEGEDKVVFRKVMT